MEKLKEMEHNGKNEIVLPEVKTGPEVDTLQTQTGPEVETGPQVQESPVQFILK